ncbi:MAG: isoamylase early set domain-containing protein [Campylobacterota bacterium]|nr:isoamylase early set domain-containing protein [Campylobacterota bacterium]
MIKIKKNGQRAWVTFTFLPSDTTESVLISGDWNEWKEEPMKQKKSGEFSITKILKVGNTFQFGYKVNGQEWTFDSDCPVVASPFHTQNSLIEL